MSLPDLKPQHFGMFAGDAKTLVVTVRDLASALVNLTGATASFALAPSVAGPATLTKSTAAGITLTDPVNGEMEIALDPADSLTLSGSYYYEAEVTDSVGRVGTVCFGNITIRPSLI